MELGDGSTSSFGIGVPRGGLVRIESEWSGRGQLLSTLAYLETERQWTEDDVRRRINRILFEMCIPFITKFPSSVRQWNDLLPAETLVYRTKSSVPVGRVDFVRSRLRGWPPSSYDVRHRDRIPESLYAAVTVWVLSYLQAVWCDAEELGSFEIETVRNQLRAAERAREDSALSGVHPKAPSRSDLDSLRRAGPPWSYVASLAMLFLRAEKAEDEFLLRLLLPDPQLAGRLFQLAVAGEVLIGAESANRPLLSTRPLSIPGHGPQYVRHGDERMELWIEGGGIWDWKNAGAPFKKALRGVSGAGRRPLSTDLLLVQDDRALVLECKYSADPSVISQGYSQVVGYSAELRLIFDEVTSVLVGPTGVVADAGYTETHVGKVIVSPADDVNGVTRDWLSNDGRAGDES